MAKRKGKSQQRLNWQQQYLHGEGDREQFSSRRKLTQRSVKLPADRVVTDMDNLEHLPKATGMVVGLFPGGVIVRADEVPVPAQPGAAVPDEPPSHRVLICGIAKAFRPPEGAEDATLLTVGDEITLALTNPLHVSGSSAGDKERSDGWILKRQPRRTVLSRPQPRSGKHRDEYDSEIFEKVIAANMDVLLMVASTCQPPLRKGLVDRFLIIAERGKLMPVVVINKIDLAQADERLIADMRGMGIAVHCVSAVSGQGLEELRPALSGRRSVLAGQSGVGKSTLINAIVPGAKAAVQTVRMKDQRGRHTTTSADVYDMPGSGMIVDTPGVRELGVSLAPRELAWYFSEFEPFAPQCKFRDCTHTHEPQCAVQQAVEQGSILSRRFESYLRILATVED